ncbi:hypothetical protein THTE_0663 [Thermogutta terrifontis]|uniref:Uncharacterized protein n=1 Tax=Thermogutta terrifontis TaxID=1331910 RepID=A0A286RBD3_9BACT|nr:hypothetical protein THTE_0663 [Thermogutta terrifontis]
MGDRTLISGPDKQVPPNNGPVRQVDRKWRGTLVVPAERQGIVYH